MVRPEALLPRFAKLDEYMEVLSHLAHYSQRPDCANGG